MATRLIGAVSAALLLSGASVLAGARSSAAQEPPGRELFDAAGCRSCHSIGGRGGNAGPDLTYVGVRRGRDWLELWLEDPRAWKKDTLMPNFRLPPKTRAAIADYLASLKGQDFGPEGPPWNKPELRSDPVRRGRSIYSRAGCVACHGTEGAGGHPNNNVPGGAIPALNMVSETFTLPELTAKIRLGVKPEKADPAGPAPLVSMPAWGQVLDESEIDAVASYLMTLKSPHAGNSEW